MKTRAALAALVILVMAAAPAAGGRTASARLESPADGSVVTGSVEISASGQSVAGIKRIEILVDSWSVASREPANYSREMRLDYSWDTNRWASDGSFAPNGHHSVVVHVTSVDGDSDRATIEVVADNPPQVPTGLGATADGARVTVTWDGNPEPDVLGYLVERDSGNGFVEVATTTEAELQQSLVPGTYAYRVTAVRESVLDEEGIASETSAPVGVTVAAARSTGSGAVTKLGGRGGKGKAGAVSGGASLAALLSNSSLPDQRGLPPIPQPPGLPWGSYEKELPYGKAAVPAPGDQILTGARGSETITLLPSDGLRWVAAGLLLLVCAGLLLVTAVRDVAGPIAALRRARSRSES